MTNTTPSRSLIGLIIDHIFGRRYWLVIVSRPNLRIKDTGGSILYETSSNLFFTYDEAKEYYQRFHDEMPNAILNTIEIHSFRSHRSYTQWSMYRENAYKRTHNNQGLIY